MNKRLGIVPFAKTDQQCVSERCICFARVRVEPPHTSGACRPVDALHINDVTVIDVVDRASGDGRLAPLILSALGDWRQAVLQLLWSSFANHC